MKSVFTVSVKGKGGGLAVFWDECFTMELNKFGDHFIDLYICKSGTKMEMHIGLWGTEGEPEVCHVEAFDDNGRAM